MSHAHYLASATDRELGRVCREHGVDWLANVPGHVLSIMVLDGADQYALTHHTSSASRKEALFRRIVGRTALNYTGQVVQSSTGADYYRDAVLASFDGNDALVRALSMILVVQRHLRDWNLEHGLGWEEQLHCRASISSDSWPMALCLLGQSAKNEVLVAPTDYAELTSGESQLLCAAIRARTGVSSCLWDDMGREQWHMLSDSDPQLSSLVRAAVSSFRAAESSDSDQLLEAVA